MPTFNTTDPKPGYVYDQAIDTWFPLLGIAPASQVDRWTKTVAGGETSLTGNDDNAVSLSYTAGTEQVYLNGVLLVRGQDYTASNGTTITGLTALAASDVAEVVTFNPSNIITTDAVLSTDFDAKGDLISASAASTPIRLPVGTNGHVLKANSATTSGLEWSAADDADAIQNSIVDAKGDIIAATAADTVARLAVGANGTVLTAASGETTGLQWATPASGGMTLLSTTTLSGASTTISAINQTHTNLLILITDAYGNSNNEIFTVSFNGAATFHDTAIYRNDTGSLSGATTFNAGSFEASKFDDSSGAAAQSCVINIYDYTSVGVKPFNSSSVMQNTSSSSNNGSFTTGRFRQTSAISSIVFAPSGGNFSAGTVRIYGVK